MDPVPSLEFLFSGLTQLPSNGYTDLLWRAVHLDDLHTNGFSHGPNALGNCHVGHEDRLHLPRIIALLEPIGRHALNLSDLAEMSDTLPRLDFYEVRTSRWVFDHQIRTDDTLFASPFRNYPIVFAKRYRDLMCNGVFRHSSISRSVPRMYG
ncbi:hypothetical protein SAMN05421504_11265 [Amycolatopsis xylanica]|uniref:Uncharacterized protein n=1 Tax=Amycolatopsis xylanica TaxID=589385 RepID=A0A1H3RXX9_9PSEU|nr:hypothetical protein SAMN05421504_11265 [Amycolatopsis xylanica]